MRTKIIINPYANRWKARKQIPAIRHACAQAGLEISLSETNTPLQAITIAREAVAAGFEAVVAAGGDGTINEVVNGLVQAAGDAQTVPFGILPIGTGNDFADMAQLPRNVEDAVQVFLRGKTRQVDIGVVTANEGIGRHFFDNNCALAMEPLVSLENIRMKRLSGTPRYIVALIKALFKLNAWEMEIAWDDGAFNGPTYLLSVCNGPRTGSTFMMFPGAKIDDGYFDVVLVPEVPLRTVFAILPRLFSGSHLQHPKVQHFRTRTLTVLSTPGTPIHADGEMIAEQATEVSYELLPGKLTLLTS